MKNKKEGDRKEREGNEPERGREKRKGGGSVERGRQRGRKERVIMIRM